ncbi:MAG TPA: IS701 family transposase [Anaeromyxobacteraceae bacterium]|nr:IS701 family transposase [Anaeromyxobacteraceae bacterium]
MADFLNPAAISRLEKYFDRIGMVLGRRERRSSFAVYAMGLLGDGERKSIEPIAARACPHPDHADAAHQRLLHFATSAPWSDRAVRREAASYALSAMTAREPVEAWILDDTGFLKQGTHSVGVQRQYTGSAGKIANCQIGVSLSIATRTEHLPIDFELYLPKSWADDPSRRREAAIPEDVRFKTKPELGLDMIRRALDDGVPRGVVLADCAYGASAEFRRSVREFGLHYAVGVNPETKVQVISASGKPSAAELSVRELAFKIQDRGGFRRCTWRKGTREDLSARFALRRVAPVHEGSEDVWLLIEWRDGETEPANYFFTTVYAKTKKKLVRLVMQRWRTERAYEDLKGELGLDHFEGRRFRGWHHHVSVALCCYAFIVAERVRRFPPSARGEDGSAAKHFAA